MKVIAHRGVSGAYPENTLLAFEKAIEEGADGVEFDLHRTKDGVLVVHHDFDLKRTAGIPLVIKETDYAELRTHDLGVWKGLFPKQVLPTLEEVLAVFRDTDLMINIELKAGSSMYPGIEAELLRVLKLEANPARFVLSSFDHPALVNLRALGSPYPLGVLTEACWIAPWAYIETHDFQTYHPNYLTLDKETVNEFKTRKIPIYTYTVNSKRSAMLMMKLGVDGIITNTPAKLKNQLNIKR
jgi:glycerophosphoryl diester phosphodiesterase